MPPIYYLNQPPHPFWDFVAGIEDHPFFARHRRPVPPTPPPQPPRPGAQQAAAAEPSEKAKGKQPEASVDDPPEIDPSTLKPEGRDAPFRGRGRFAKYFEDNGNKDNADENNSGRRGGRGRHGHHHGHGPWGAPQGPPPFSFGPPPFGPPPFVFSPHGPFGPRGPPGPEAPEGHGPRGGCRGRGGFHRGHGGPHHHHHGPHSPSPPRDVPGDRQGQASGFDLGTFLSNLGERLGVDLTAAAEGLGIRPPRSSETDFEPRTDIFDTSAAYTVHLSLPGAKKSDVGVDWDGEHSALRVAGVVHRPGVDEEMMSRLVVDGRKRETGVFEKTIRLGTSKAPASVDVEGITAKMVDGVLIIRVPKVEKTFEKKEVYVGGGSSPSPAPSNERPEDAYMNEKDLLFDAGEDEEQEDKDMYDADSVPEPQHQPPPTLHVAPESKPSALADITMGETAKVKEKEREAEENASRERDDRSETLGFEDSHNETVETLPRYEPEDSNNKVQGQPQEQQQHQQHANVDDEDNMSDWEKYGSEDEGEYVKINVD
ncbi:uncharacterized protein A1O5_10261 [Cladophialophora psammophila CBS 110553]|uniref:SHSP domain-containing protein n=1 Tax=Cladophialophora psammophila CBS 110553 TaxID=1182543 RepID=W9WPJ4_9EURO|nr:uncharacterized protein A1O5_10261 [Cladophialophora psammophila CBS 110553]EXJ66591.1 hypothetical protein A1O5_10261 [Cladophialophora psammophila CBS 110553]